ncbi:MAG: hypothetical protein AB1673_10830 [Actinomycetota bacterium]
MGTPVGGGPWGGSVVVASPKGRAGHSVKAAYGLVIAGPVVSPGLAALVPDTERVPPGWPTVTLHHRQGSGAEPPTAVTTSHAVLASPAGRHLVFDRRTMTATVVAPQCPDDYVLAHPCLAGVGMVVACWLGRSALHGGAFLGTTGAWGVLGGVKAGKSTTLAALHHRGRTVLADDLLIVDAGLVLAGPRVLSLRLDAAERLAPDAARVGIGGELRARLRLRPAPVATPLSGLLLVELHEGHPHVKTAPIPPSERFDVLATHLAQRYVMPSALGLLELATVPMWRVTAPRSWSAIDRLVGAIDEIADGHGVDAA